MLLKQKLLCAAAFLAFSFRAAVADDVTFKYISADEAKKEITAPGPGPGYIVNSDMFRLRLAIRDKPGKVEQHVDWADEIIIQEGDVLLNYGGTSVNAKVTTPGELVGDSIVGGKSVLMHPGDIVTIPAGMPHQMIVETPIMRYLLFKTKKQ